MSTFKKKFPTFDEAGHSVEAQLRIINRVNNPEKDEDTSAKPLGDFCLAAEAFNDNSVYAGILREDPTLRWVWSNTRVDHYDFEDAFRSDIEDEGVLYRKKEDSNQDLINVYNYEHFDLDNGRDAFPYACEWSDFPYYGWLSYFTLGGILQTYRQRSYAYDLGFEEDHFGKVTNPRAFSKADLINKIMRVLGVDINDAATRTNLEGFSQAQLFRKLQQKETYLADSQEEYLSLLPLDGFDTDIFGLDISQLSELINAAYEKIYPPFDEDLDDHKGWDDLSGMDTSSWPQATSDLAWEDDIYNPHNT